MGGGNYEYSGAFDDDLSSALNGVYGREQQRDAAGYGGISQARVKEQTPIAKSPVPVKPTTKRVHVGTITLDKKDADKLKRLSLKCGDVARAVSKLIHDADI